MRFLSLFLAKVIGAVVAVVGTILLESSAIYISSFRFHIYPALYLLIGTALVIFAVKMSTMVNVHHEKGV